MVRLQPAEGIATVSTRLLRLCSLIALILTLAAGGSRMDPETVARATGGNQPGNQQGLDGGEVASGDAGAVVTDPGAVDDPAAAPDAGDIPAGGDDAPAGPGAASGSGGGASSGGGGSTSKGSATGGVPGIFESAQEGTRAFVEYLNRSNDICGRKLAMLNLDSRADSGADQQAYTKARAESFAAIGSMSAFDSGGAGAAQQCGLPDIRYVSATPERQKCATCFAVYAVRANLIPIAGGTFLNQKYPDATKNAAVFYLKIGGAVPNAMSFAAGLSKHAGWDVKFTQGIDVAEFNYSPYVQQMKDKGIKAVLFYSSYQPAVKFQQAMQQQGYKPDIYYQDNTIYDARYIKQAGSAADGVFSYLVTDTFENKSNPEMNLYLRWLKQIKPSATPTAYGVYAWSAARLFVEQVTQLGGKLTRPALVSAMRKVTAWDGNGIHTSMNPATGATPPCLRIVRYNGKAWQQVTPGKYVCDKVVDTGVGG